MFGKKKEQAPISEDDRKIILGMIWCLKPSDLSILFAMKQVVGDGKAMTSRRSVHGKFWQKLVMLGLANEGSSEIDLNADYLKNASSDYIDGLKDLTSYMPTPEGKKLIFDLLVPATTTGWPPKGSTLSSEAVQMLEQYAEEGTTPSQSKLAYLYDKGIGVDKNLLLALKWNRMAAEKGDPTALNNLGIMYLFGQGVEKDASEAMRWFKMGAEKGSVGAMDNLGEMYGRALGIPQNFSESFDWFRMAAEHGHVQARGKLGDFYSKGLGISQDDKQAYIWYSLAIAAGLDAAQKLVTVTQRLTPEQIKEANTFLAGWKPRSIG